MQAQDLRLEVGHQVQDRSGDRDRRLAATRHLDAAAAGDLVLKRLVRGRQLTKTREHQLAVAPI
jgi:hypothetical protein